MFGLGKKKDEAVAAEPATENADGEEKKPVVQHTEVKSDNPDIIRAFTEIDRMKASVESFSEVRKTMMDRMAQLSEQIGELRAMIMDRDRSIREIELKAIKASELVETVQPEKLMLEVQKEDAKFEALKANLEGHDAMMERVMDELRELRRKLEFFKGIEEVIKLAEETKKELVEIKKVEATIHLNADKMDSIYSEMRKKYQSAELMTDSIEEMKARMEQNSKDVDLLKGKITDLARKEDLDKMVERMQKYIDSLKELATSSALSKDIGRLKMLLDTMK